MLQKCIYLYSDAKHRHSITFSSIYIGGHFLVCHEGESHKRSQKVTQVTICHRSEHHDVFVVYMSTSASALLPQTRDKSDSNLWRHAVSVGVLSLWLPDLQSSQHCREQRTGTKLGEGMNCLL